MGMKEQGVPNKTNTALLMHHNHPASPRQKDAIKRMGKFEVYPAVIATKGGASLAIQALRPEWCKKVKKMDNVFLPAACFCTKFGDKGIPEAKYIPSEYKFGATVAMLKEGVKSFSKVAIPREKVKESPTRGTAKEASEDEVLVINRRNIML